jgi:hypothetical protein
LAAIGTYSAAGAATFAFTFAACKGAQAIADHANPTTDYTESAFI